MFAIKVYVRTEIIYGVKKQGAPSPQKITNQCKDNNIGATWQPVDVVTTQDDEAFLLPNQ